MSESIRVSVKTKKRIDELADMKGQKQIYVLESIVRDYHKAAIKIVEDCTCDSGKYYGPDHKRDCPLYLPF